jgi:hypothetical protein
MHKSRFTRIIFFVFVLIALLLNSCMKAPQQDSSNELLPDGLTTGHWEGTLSNPEINNQPNPSPENNSISVTLFPNGKTFFSWGRIWGVFGTYQKVDRGTLTIVPDNAPSENITVNMNITRSENGKVFGKVLIVDDNENGTFDYVMDRKVKDTSTGNPETDYTGVWKPFIKETGSCVASIQREDIFGNTFIYKNLTDPKSYCFYGGNGDNFKLDMWASIGGMMAASYSSVDNYGNKHFFLYMFERVSK